MRVRSVFNACLPNRKDKIIVQYGSFLFDPNPEHWNSDTEIITAWCSKSTDTSTHIYFCIIIEHSNMFLSFSLPIQTHIHRWKSGFAIVSSANTVIGFIVAYHISLFNFSRNEKSVSNGNSHLS